MRSLAFALTLSGGVLAGGLSAAHAAPLSATELLQQYNLITKGDVFSSQEIEGNVYIGGDLNGWTLQYAFRSAGDLPDPELAELVIHGDNNLQNINATTGTTVVIGGANKGNVNGSPAKVIVGSIPSDLVPNRDEVFAALDAASAELKAQADALAATGGLAAYVVGEQGYTFGGGVYALSFDDLTKKEITFNLGKDEVAILNVAGNPGTIQKNFLGNWSDYASSIVWNFFEATEIALDSKFVGAILAPNAKISGFSGSSEGSVYAESVFLMNGEIHNPGFNVDLSGGSQPSPVPLPAAAPLLLAGIGALAALRRRRKAA